MNRSRKLTHYFIQTNHFTVILRHFVMNMRQGDSLHTLAIFYSELICNNDVSIFNVYLQYIVYLGLYKVSLCDWTIAI